MATEHRVTFGQVIITAIGLALLAGQQNWASDNLIWSPLLGGIDLGILLRRGRNQQPDHQPADRGKAQIGSPHDHGPR